MIKETIAIHFEKEKFLFEQGIKALTLFLWKVISAYFAVNILKSGTFLKKNTKNNEPKL